MWNDSVQTVQVVVADCLDLYKDESKHKAESLIKRLSAFIISRESAELVINRPYSQINTA